MSVVIRNYDIHCNECGNYIYSGTDTKFLTEEDIDLFRKKSFCIKCREAEEKREKEQRIATQEDWDSKLDKPCQSLWTDFGEPRCSKQVCCFIFNDNFTCPEGRILKEIK